MPRTINPSQLLAQKIIHQISLIKDAICQLILSIRVIELWCLTPLSTIFQLILSSLNGVMVNVLASSAVDQNVRVPVESTKNLKNSICRFICTQDKGLRAKTAWLRIRIIITCPCGVACISTDCCESELHQLTNIRVLAKYERISTLFHRI